jgi:hypothetical protein
MKNKARLHKPGFLRAHSKLQNHSCELPTIKRKVVDASKPLLSGNQKIKQLSRINSPPSEKEKREVTQMHRIKLLAATAVAGFFLLLTSPKTSEAQVSVNIGVAPSCPYGYYEAPPYACAPYGYYGPEWFSGGAFIGAGPWFHGPANFNGHVDNHFHPEHGYTGPMPHAGDRPEAGHEHPPANFHGNEVHDGHGHVR